MNVRMKILIGALYCTAADISFIVIRTEASPAMSITKLSEMRAVAFATRLIDSGELDETKHSRMFMHWIGNDRLMSELGTATQFHPEWRRVEQLRDVAAHRHDDVILHSLTKGCIGVRLLLLHRCWDVRLES
jgi:hypothetical protein